MIRATPGKWCKCRWLSFRADSRSGNEDGDRAGNGEDAEHGRGGREQCAVASEFPPEEHDAGGDYDQDQDELSEGHTAIIEEPGNVEHGLGAPGAFARSVVSEGRWVRDRPLVDVAEARSGAEEDAGVDAADLAANKVRVERNIERDAGDVQEEQRLELAVEGFAV